MADVLTEDTFDAVVGAAGVPYLVDFWASWCGRCRLLAPSVEAVARDYDGRLRVGTVDVEAHPAIAERLGITSLPTLLLLEPGAPEARLTGVITPAALRALVSGRCGDAAGS